MNAIRSTAVCLALGAALLTPRQARADDEPGPLTLRVGGGLEGVGYGYFIPTSGRARLDLAIDYAVSPVVELRLLPSLSFGLGVNYDLFFDLSGGVAAALRLRPTPVYTIWLGYAARVGVAAEVEDASETVGALGVHGPQLSLTSFRFGEQGRFELDHWGELLLPPFAGYGFALAFRARVE
ncbi:MAG: hypothetical protein IPG04_40790 [Polyangiaceae bacterium]|nr:hypothetical protein [Polyangiaceae bacterium]